MLRSACTLVTRPLSRPDAHLVPALQSGRVGNYGLHLVGVLQEVEEADGEGDPGEEDDGEQRGQAHRVRVAVRKDFTAGPPRKAPQDKGFKGVGAGRVGRGRVTDRRVRGGGAAADDGRDERPSTRSLMFSNGSSQAVDP